MKQVLPYATLVLTALACTSDDSLTEPGTPDQPSAAAAAVATAPNSWSLRAAYEWDHGLYGSAVAMAPNSAGESIVYLFGGTEGEFDVGYPVRAYNATADAWTVKSATADVYHSNGAAKIGSKIYFSGGFTVRDDFDFTYSNTLWAYDYGRDVMIRKLELPVRSAEGVSGVIDGKLYVLPGSCLTEGYPAPGTCSKRATNRFFRYDPATNRLVTRTSAPHFHANGAAGVIDGKLYVVGGTSRALDVYDPVTNKWTTRAPIPAAGRAIGAVIGRKFFVIVGSHMFDQKMYEYDSRTNVWRSRARPKWAHDGMARVVLDGIEHLIAAGGGHGFGTELPNENELYTR
jgi:N-acetylneuraminic acid mutarotase